MPAFLSSRAVCRLLAVVLFLSGTVCAYPEQLKFSDVVKASLVFRAEHNPSGPYPHVLNVYLRLENTHDANVSWVADSVAGIRAELLDADGRPVPIPMFGASIGSNPGSFLLPYGSSMDWLISHGGVSMVGDLDKMYAVVIGGRGWLVPIGSIGSCTLRLQLYGRPWTRDAERVGLGELPLLIDLPATKIRVTK